MFDREVAIAEIQNRNQLRKHALLPHIPVEKELIRYEKAAAQKEWYDFYSSPLCDRVQSKRLARIRRKIGDPTWKPFGLLSGGGWAFENAVSRTMKRIWRMRQNKRVV